MAVSLVPKFNRSDITAAIMGRKQLIEAAILLRLQRIGEQFVANARNNADFKDHTGNLRSSIGYVVLKNGQQLNENFKEVAGGKEGISNAKKIIAEAKSKFTSGYVLIGVAGMDYAAAVESKGYDVITVSAGTAASNLRLAVQQIVNKLK